MSELGGPLRGKSPTQSRELGLLIPLQKIVRRPPAPMCPGLIVREALGVGVAVGRVTVNALLVAMLTPWWNNRSS
jgi:hypothetical protein